MSNFYDTNEHKVKPMLKNIEYSDDEYFAFCKTLCLHFLIDADRIDDISDDDILEIYSFVAIRQEEMSDIIETLELDTIEFTSFERLSGMLKLSANFTPMSSVIETTLYDSIKLETLVIIEELLMLGVVINKIIRFRNIRFN